jgi:hypothetical protein
VLVVVNIELNVVGVRRREHLILVTLVLAWLANTFAAADLVATTDVREESDEDDGDASNLHANSVPVRSG